MLQLYVHNKNYEAMYKYIPKDVLPTEYGGNGGSVKDNIGRYYKIIVHTISPKTYFRCLGVSLKNTHS